MRTAMVPIIKNITWGTSDKDNYRPIALVTPAIEICIIDVLETYLLTHDHLFRFKPKHSTDMCIFTVKSLINIIQIKIPLFIHGYWMPVKLLIKSIGRFLQS